MADDPNDPFPSEEGIGGAAFMRRVAAWEKRQAARDAAAAPKKTGPVGPQYKPGLGVHTNPAPSIFENYPGPMIDAAKTLTKNYMALLGFPQNVDTEQMALFLLQGNLENQPQAAYEAFWNSKFMNNDMRKATPWARFGQEADTFHMNLASAQATLKTMTGLDIPLGDMALNPEKPDAHPGSGAEAGPDPMASLLQAAIKGNMSQAQILQMFQSGSFTDIDGKKIDLTGIVKEQPWLTSGQTYQQQAQQFHTIYGAAPVDSAQLAGWYRFNQSAASMGPWYARQAVVSSPGKMPTAVGQTEVR